MVRRADLSPSAPSPRQDQHSTNQEESIVVLETIKLVEEEGPVVTRDERIEILENENARRL